MYAITLDGHTYTPNGRDDAIDVASHNAAMEAAELAEWASAPDAWYGYDANLDGTNGTLTTGSGKPLGRIVERRTYRNRLTGSRMTSLRIKGNNGATYYGRYGSDWSQFVRIRKAKAS